MVTGWTANWLVQESKKTKLSPAQLCPCDSGWVLASCCFDPSDGKLRKKVQSIEPPQPKTSFSHVGCYLRDTNDCSPDISREHYISASVLEQIAASGKAVNISGAPFLAEGEIKALPIQGLTAKILCQRHNAALSPLDQEAGKFFQMLTDVMMRKVIKRRLWLASGTALELWMLKVACGFYFSGIGSSNRNRNSKTHSIDMRKVIDAFEGKWGERAGLYFNGHAGTVLKTAFNMQVSPLTDDVAMKLGGVRIALLGFECDLIFDTSGTPEGIWTGVVHRPHELNFDQENGRKRSLLLSWSKGTKPSAINFGLASQARANG